MELDNCNVKTELWWHKKQWKRERERSMAELCPLKLVIEKGPRSGETLRFLPSDPLIRLGRVRDNSLVITDYRLSAYQLTIEFKSPDWLITDLNGTVLNSAELPSNSATVLRDGDVVEIGGVTVIRVGIGGPDAMREVEKRPRGRPRREKAVSAEDDAEKGFGKRGRGRPRKERAVEESVGPVEPVSKNQTVADKEEREKGGGDCVKESLGPPDLATMTLRDYFDYLEVNLPKQIIYESELIIAEMHNKAKLYREFVRENNKGGNGASK